MPYRKLHWFFLPFNLNVPNFNWHRSIPRVGLRIGCKNVLLMGPIYAEFKILPVIQRSTCEAEKSWKVQLARFSRSVAVAEIHR